VSRDFETITAANPIGPARGDACLIVVSTPTRSELGRVLVLSKSLTLGRGREADLSLSDASMSRRHARLTLTEAGVQLEDLGSRNGCFVNGVRVSQVDLRHGDQLRLGATTLHFHAQDGAGPGPGAEALTQSGVAQWDYDVALGAVRWSRQAETALELPKGALGDEARPLRELLHAAQWAEVATALEAPGQAPVVEVDARLALAPGTWWVRLRGQVLRGEDGRPRRISGTAVNVTAAKHREHAVARAGQFFENLPEPVIVADADGRVVELNGAALDAFAVQRGEARGRDVFAVAGASPGEGVRQEALEALAKSGAWTASLQLRVAGQARPHRVTGFRLQDGAEALGLAFLFRDVSEQHRWEAQLDQMERMASLHTLSAGIAHELNNPLSYVLANARVALERLQGHPDEDLREALAELVEGSERIAGIVGDLRVFARGDAEFGTHPTDLGAVVEAARKLTAKWVDARASLTVELTASPLVEAHERRLEQVLVNLLINAAQAIPERAEGKGRILVRAQPSDGGVALEVVDDGEGMTPDVQRRIFEPFFTTRPVGVGTGLGLAVCHGLVRSMGGTLTVRSAPGEGSTFRLWLRVAQPRRVEAPTPAPCSGGERKLKVLLVDDEPLVLKALARILKAHEVTTVSSVRAALEHFSAGARFDVLLCDLMMPEQTGIDLYERLKVEVPEQAARMVFLTGGAFTERADRFLKSVRNRQLIKPVDATVLRQTVFEVGGALQA
jgi:PAS domain S-box-containing protein